MFAAGYPAPELHVDSNLIHYRKMELIGTFSADKCDFERAAELMREKKIDLSKLVEAKYKLDDVEQAFDQKELTQAIDGFLDHLSPKKRSIFIRRYWYTDSISEIAARHNMRDGAVSMTLNRLRLKLRSYLLERGFEL